MSRTVLLTGILLILTLPAAGALAAGDGGGGGAGIFSGDLGTAIWTVLICGGLVVILGKFAWGPVLEGLQAREKHIRDQIAAADGARQEADALRSEVNEQRSNLVKAAEDDARRRAREIVSQAQSTAAATKEQTRTEVDFARATALDKVRDQAVDLVTALTQEVLGAKDTSTDTERLINEAVTGLKKSSRGASA